MAVLKFSLRENPKNHNGTIDFKTNRYVMKNSVSGSLS